MRKNTMRRILFILTLLCSLPLYAAVNLSPLYIHLSDAMSAAKQGDSPQAAAHLQTLQHAFTALAAAQSDSGQNVQQALAQAMQQPDSAALENLSRALYAFEKEQNPVDHKKMRERFSARVLPVYQQLARAIDAQNLPDIHSHYKRFNSTWTANEKAVRDTSLGHYGKIETAMSFVRIAMLAEPPDYPAMRAQTQALGAALQSFIAGETVAAPPDSAQTLAGGIALLEQALGDMQSGASDNAREALATFIRQWPDFEGEVRTRDGALYTRVESELPLILAQAGKPDSAARLEALLAPLQAIDVQAQYGIIDAMLILLREGVEALLIVMALLTALQAAGQTRGKHWVYAGAGLGIAASIAGAIALQRLFPAVSAGANREILEGVVGIVAVAMMLLVGGWLHGKSSLRGWQRFVDKHIARAIATGSLFSMAALSFLAVFREGAETILFYAGIVPRTSLADLLGGIILALVLLAVIAVLIRKAGQRLPLHHLFKVMTWLIYALGFKILGVSIHALQLTKILPAHLTDLVPAIPFIGLYPSWEGIAAQALYLALIPLMARIFR